MLLVAVAGELVLELRALEARAPAARCNEIELGARLERPLSHSLYEGMGSVEVPESKNPRPAPAELVRGLRGRK